MLTHIDSRNVHHRSPPQIEDYHYVENLSDVWMEETDPDNWWGEFCSGFFTEEDGFFTLVGLNVEDGKSDDYLNREQAIKVLGYETVCRVERVMERTYE